MPTHPVLTYQAFPEYQELAGKTVHPGDERFDQARSAWNLAVDQQPAAIVLAETAEDVRAAVRLAADRGLRIAAQGTGHLAMPLGDLTDTILLKTAANWPGLARATARWPRSTPGTCCTPSA